MLGRQETQGPFAAGGGRGEAGALAGDGVGQGLRIDRENWRVEGNGKAVSVTCKGDRPSPLPGRASGHGFRPPPAYRTGNPPWAPSQGGFPRQRDRKGCKKRKGRKRGPQPPAGWQQTCTRGGTAARWLMCSSRYWCWGESSASGSSRPW